MRSSSIVLMVHWHSPKSVNEGDIGVANYEKLVEQEAAYPHPYIFVQLLQDSEA